MLPHHNVASISWTSNGCADALQQHDRQRAAEVLLELVEAAQDAARMRPSASRCSRQAPACRPASPSAASRLDDAPPVRFRQESRPDASRSCRARCRCRPPRHAAADSSVSCSSLCAAQWPKSSGRDEPSSNGSPPVAMCARCSAADRRITCSIAGQVARSTSAAACCSMKSKNGGSG